MSSFGEILDGYLKALEAGNAPDREALLARHPDLADELAAAFLGLDFIRGATPSLSREDAEVGRTLGDYKLLREIGRGGMAVVYEAEQVSLGRRVALKVLPFAAVLDPKQLQRFKNEAMAAAHLHHPHIVPVHAVGSERGVHYYAMHYVEGQSLAAAIRDMKGGGSGEGPRTPISSHGSNREPAYIRMAAALGVQAAEALDHAHQLGIVHRDVKPGNLLVDEAGTLWVTDFGLASSVADVGLTMTGEILGTIRYMSPEQALAKRVPIDHRTDVYSLGATLYELFTLEPAFPGDDPHVVIQDIARKEPVAPRRLNPALPVDLETVLLKAMTKDAASRYATAQEMAEDLRRYLDDQAVLARRPSVVSLAAKWSRRHRGLVAASVAALLLAVVLLAIGTYRVTREQRRTQAALEALQRKQRMLRAAAEAFSKDLDGLDPVTRRVALDRALAYFDKAIAIDPDDAAAHHNRGYTFNAMGRFEEAVAAYDRAIAINPDNPLTHNNRASSLGALGRFDEMLLACDRAIEIDPDFAFAHSQRGLALGRLGRLADALAAHDRAISIEPREAGHHHHRGLTLQLVGRHEEALAALDRAIELRPGDASIRFRRGLSLNALDRSEEALGAFDEAVAIDRHSADAHQGRSAILEKLGRFDEALAAAEEVARLDPEDPQSRYWLGLARHKSGDLNGAIPEFQEAIRLDRLRPGMSGNVAAAAHCKIGDAHALRGLFQEASEAYREAIKLDRNMALAHENLGTTLLNTHNLDGAIAEFHEAIRLDPAGTEAHGKLGLALLLKGDAEGAIAAYGEATRHQPKDATHWTNLGKALADRGHVDDAIDAYSEAIRLDPSIPEAHNNLGVALHDKGETDRGIQATREAIRLKPDYADAHHSLGVMLQAKGDAEGALSESREVARLRPDDPLSRYCLGKLLMDTGRLDDAIREYDAAIHLKPDYAEAHCNRGIALGWQGRYRDAMPSIRRGHELGSARPDWKYPSRRWVEDVERGVEWEERLDRVLAGDVRPGDASERIGFANLLHMKSLHAEAAQMYAEAFAESATIAEDLEGHHRYNAACAAALAAARGGDATAWRNRALEWLRADLAAREKAGRADTLKHWSGNADLALVRDSIQELPEAEREGWARFWADVNAALARAQKKQ